MADRIIKRLSLKESVRKRTREAAAEIAARLMFYRFEEVNPPDEEALPAQEEALDLARRLVDLLEVENLGDDRLGQLVRNLFECLGAGKEGAEASLRAGENPHSLQRPWSGPPASG